MQDDSRSTVGGARFEDGGAAGGPRHVRELELLLGVEGLALLRRMYDSSDDEAGRRVDEVREIVGDASLERGAPIREAGARDGYREWSQSYDGPGNPIVALEQPVVWSLLSAEPGGAQPGRALDAACGTGRHAARLVELGYDVVGVDLTPEMLSFARANIPEADFLEGDVRSIPAADAEFDVVVCALAVAHLPDVASGISELARVLAPGGQLVISALHPMLACLGWQAPFAGPDGERGFVREYAHGHGDYLRAFRSAGLEVADCQEPELAVSHVREKRRAFGRIPDATTQAYAGLPGVLVWDLRKA